ncbi:MAG: carbohydrate ABC transporter permease [Coprobacillus sp.]|nr:carbohydrate ABC transporter permease [Coprobacillus sp.]MDY4145052.1 carbohydrate ABC transporter permease [Bacilli bacterium]CCY08369.1 aBC-type transport system permease component [Coprobacillus sp. CAG:698]
MALFKKKVSKSVDELEKEKFEQKNAKKARHIDSRPFAEISNMKVMRRSKKKKRINRSRVGDFFLFLFLLVSSILSILPLIMIVNNAFKPLDEIFKFPPTIFVINPTLNNFADLGVVLGTSLVPFSRYLFNTVYVTILGTFGHVIVASMCSYVLSRYNVPGGKVIFSLIVYALMFPSSVTATPNYIILNWLGLIDTHWSIVLPVIGGTLGLFLMKQFMDQISMEYIESAKLDGAGEFKIYWSIVMPLVKPAWITLVILNFQSLWNTYGSTTIYREDLKMLSYAINQIASAGVARTGTLNAVQLVMIIVPIAVFIFSQSNVMETMAHSGMK